MLELMLTQVIAPASPPLHSVWFVGQLVVHLPATHASVLMHAAPHLPQLFESVFVLTQFELHIISPVGHVVVQAPAMHASPIGHTFPHIPQFEPSVCVFVHVPLQLVGVEPVQLDAAVQLPPEQVCPVGHTVPHAPQFLSSVTMSTHLPLQLVEVLPEQDDVPVSIDAPGASVDPASGLNAAELPHPPKTSRKSERIRRPRARPLQRDFDMR
jgi:hypothetical protein